MNYEISGEMNDELNDEINYVADDDLNCDYEENKQPDSDWNVVE
jgi:hypothetical protein